MSQQNFKALVDLMGGREAFIDRMNEAIAEAGDTAHQRMRERTFYNWHLKGLPLAEHLHVLAAAKKAGIDADEATRIFPELRPALALVRKVAA